MMDEFAKVLGFFIISVFLMCIPLLTCLRLGAVGEFEFLTLCGTIITIWEVLILTILLYHKYE